MTVGASDQWNALGSFRFGDSDELADQLLALVISGLKRATGWAARDGRKIKAGWRLAVEDNVGEDRALTEVVELVKRPFLEVNDSFARDEGEGDLSLDTWRSLHRNYFARAGEFDEAMEV